MIRPAKFVDAPAIEGLIRRQHAASKYVSRVEISDKALKQLLSGLHASQGQSSVGASSIFVAVRGQKVVGFVAGVLQRTYFIGNRLEAGDIFLINEGTLADLLGLGRAYVEWAKTNRKVLDVKMSWTDTMPGAERMSALFRRLGLKKLGEVWGMSTDAVQEEGSCLVS